MTRSAIDLELPFIAPIEPILSFNFQDRGSLQSAGQKKLVSRLHILGPQTHPSRIAHFSGHTLAFGIFLKPLALWKLFRIPSRILTDTDIAGEDVLGKSFQSLWQRLAESQTFAARISLAEQYLLPFALNVVDRTCIMKSAEHIFSHNGATRIGVLANHAALSLRQYERRFTQETGISPKLFARITRFQVALDTKRLTPSNPWLSIAHEFGYHDQMHMIRDFRDLGGDAPGIVSSKPGIYSLGLWPRQRHAPCGSSASWKLVGPEKRALSLRSTCLMVSTRKYTAIRARSLASVSLVSNCRGRKTAFGTRPAGLSRPKGLASREGFTSAARVISG